MTTRVLNEVDAAAFLGCSRFTQARKVLRAIEPAATLPDGPRWTETQLLQALGERPQRVKDPTADELRLLQRLQD